jgi:hypothetical protein
VVSAIRSASQDPGKPEVADALDAAIVSRHPSESVVARKGQQEEALVSLALLNRRAQTEGFQV